MTAIVKVIVHELRPSNIHVIVESQDRNDWNTEPPYPSNSFYLQLSNEFLIVIYLQTRHHPKRLTDAAHHRPAAAQFSAPAKTLL